MCSVNIETHLKPFPIFAPGQIVATPGALETMERHGVLPTSLLRRHLSGDWGNLSLQDVRANDDAVVNHLRLLSSYNLIEPTDAEHQHLPRIWVITEADRSVTTFLLPEEY